MVFIVPFHRAWKEKLGAGSSKIHFIADDAGEFTTALGLLFDATGLLGGPRAKVRSPFPSSIIPLLTLISLDNRGMWWLQMEKKWRV